MPQRAALHTGGGDGTVVVVGLVVVVDATLNPPGSAMTVVLNTAQADGAGHAGPHAVGSKVTVRRAPDGTAFVAIRDVPPSETLVLVNWP